MTFDHENSTVWDSHGAYFDPPFHTRRNWMNRSAYSSHSDTRIWEKKRSRPSRLVWLEWLEKGWEGHVHHWWPEVRQVASKPIEGCHMAVTRGRFQCRCHALLALPGGRCWSWGSLEEIFHSEALRVMEVTSHTITMTRGRRRILFSFLFFVCTLWWPWWRTKASTRLLSYLTPCMH